MKNIAPFLILLIALMSSCGSDSDDVSPDYKFEKYVSAYTSGTISKQSSVVVVFRSTSISGVQINKPLETNPFSIDPDVSGQVKWTGLNTLEFVPDELLPSDQKFKVILDLQKLNSEVPDSLSEFTFSFKTRKQHINIKDYNLSPISSVDLTWQKLMGVVSTNDFEPGANIEKYLEMFQDGKQLGIKWEHSPMANMSVFTVDSVERKIDKSEIKIRYNANHLGIEDEGEVLVNLPGLSDFEVISVKSFSYPDQYIEVQFSDPINVDQNIDGLVRILGQNVTLERGNSSVKLFPRLRLRGNYSVKVDKGIQNIMGHGLQNEGSFAVEFTEIKPQLESIGSKTIMPNSEVLPFNFRAAGLSHVDVRVIKISQRNVSQFLQVNKINGSNELKRVGHVISKKTIELNQNGKLDLGNWNIHTLDLAPLIKQEPGAIYEVAIGFRKSYSLYTCTDTLASHDIDMLALDENWHLPTVAQVEEEDSYWDYYEEDYEEEDNGDQSDPCDDAYYTSDKVIKRNVIASSIGLIAKRGSSGDMFLVASDLKTTRPLANITIQVYNYQQHVLKTVVTNVEGIAKFKLREEPFLLVAKKGKERGYLKLDQGSSLSLSKFDVSGKKYHKGIKGFIFGERGVWRPGDDIHLNFILEDKSKELPAKHPVTFEFFGPQGQLVHRTKNVKGIDGFYALKCKTKASDVTGNYSVKVHVGGAHFEKLVKVETIVPNRLKMKLDFDFPYLSSSSDSAMSTLESKWLHGAIAKNLNANVSVSLVPIKTRFKTFRDYIFDDPVNKFRGHYQTLFEGDLDELGKASIPANISVGEESAPGMLKANFKTKVFEPGGNFSTDRFSLPYHMYENYVGVKLPKGDAARGMLLTDTTHNVKIALVDVEGNPVADGQVEVAIYKVEWKWWWDNSAYSLPQYNGRVNTSAIQKGIVDVKDGEAVWKFRIDYPDWGRYLIRAHDKNGHYSGKIVYIDWPGWAGRGEESSAGGGAKMLTFSSDKKKYNVGEDITLMIPTPNKGRALVSIESGTKVITSYWVNAVEGTSRLTFKATKDMAPNIYAHVTLLQPHAHFENDRPMRLHGVIPIMVEDPSTRLSPVIVMNDVLEPMSKVTIKVSEQKGRKMTCIVAVVDEGLLGLTRFRTPNPWSTFYQREALDIMTWDIYDDIIGAEGVKIRNLLSIGGGDEAGGKEGKKPNRFKPVVKFFGPFEVGSDQTKTINFEMPNYIGAVRTMVVARSGESYGAAEKETPVKTPLMVLGTLPRVLGPNETFDLPVTVFLLDDKVSKVNVSLSSNSKVEIIGKSSKTISFSEIGEKMISFKVRVKEGVGKANFVVKAKGGKERATFSETVEIRCANPMITEVQSKQLKTGESTTFNFKPFGLEGTNIHQVEVSLVPSIDLSKRLAYLIRYPHGCVEQTTSSVFPQIHLNKLQKLNRTQQKSVEKNIKAGIRRLTKFQTSEGGLSYWPGQYNVNEWGTNYAGNFILEAKEAGYSVPSNFLKKWIAYQKKKAAGWHETTESSHLIQAYRLYLLVKAGSPDLGAMNRMRMIKEVPVTASHYLALAYLKAGHKNYAEALIKDKSLSVKNYNELSGTFGSGIRDQSILLESLLALGDTKKAYLLSDEIAQVLGSDKHLNTQATAYSLIALARYYDEQSLNHSMNVSYELNGKNHSINSAMPIYTSILPVNGKGSNSLKINNGGGSKVYCRLISEGQPLTVDTVKNCKGLSINVAYKDMNGNYIEVNQIKQGSDFVAVVTVSDNKAGMDLDELALTAIFPSGWELHNSRLDEISFGNSDRFDYQDIRDDRVYTYFDLNQNASKTFQFLLNASYIGKFYLPSIYVEAMYDHEINCKTKGSWTEVVK
ncbi:MAG: hypothetical protein ACJA0Q_001312 [Saprospiraceae bacterium]|jgi:uncharacterized protein YfaS (alpha-2-macroglobulin family)